MINIWEWLIANIGGAILGAVVASSFSFVWWLWQKIRKKKLYDRLYEGYVSSYECRLKDKEKNCLHFKIELTRKGNKFIVNGTSCTTHDNVTGEIEMSDTIPSYGKGYYYHYPTNDKTVQKFGFYEIQLAEQYILVHQIIKGLKENKIEGEDKSMSYVWIKTSDNNPH